jgi:hypothetical protein
MADTDGQGQPQPTRDHCAVRHWLLGCTATPPVNSCFCRCRVRAQCHSKVPPAHLTPPPPGTHLQQVWLIGTCKPPAHIRRRVPHVCAHAVWPPAHVIAQRCRDDGRQGGQAVGQQQAATRQLSQCQAAAMPCSIRLCVGGCAWHKAYMSASRRHHVGGHRWPNRTSR